MKPTTSARRFAHIPWPAAAFGLLVFSGNPIHAQQTPTAAEEETIELPQFTVSSDAADRYRATDAVSSVRVRAPLLETPSSITVFTRDIIDDLAPSRVFEVTRYAAGVQEGRGIQFQDRMILRGFESNGQRVVDNFLQPDDAENINDVIIERIEISKGPNAILSPAGGPGGTVNIITKSPLFRNNRTITGLIGLFDAQEVTLDMTGPLNDKLAYRLIANYQDTRRYWASDAKMENEVIAPMITYRISDRTQLTVKFIGAQQWTFREPLLVIHPDVTPETDDPYLAPGLSKRSRNGIQPWSHAEVNTADLFAVLTSSWGDHISFRAAANSRYYYTNSVQQFLSMPSLNNTRYNPLTGDFTQDYVWRKEGDTYVSTYSPLYHPAAVPNRGDAQWTRFLTNAAQADVAARYDFGTVTSQTVLGGAINHRDGWNRVKSGTMPDINLTQPDRLIYPVWSPTLYANNDTRFTNWQVYLNERLGFWKDRIIVTGGLLHYDTYTWARNALSPTNLPNILDDSKDMYMVGALVKVRDNASIYYSHSTNSSPVIANNQPLWRDGVQDEFGFKTEFFNQRLSINAAYFEISQTNVTTPNPERQTNPNAPEQVVQDLSDHGYELEVVGGITKDFSIIGTYTHLKLRDALGRDVRAVADNTAALLANYRFNDGQLNGLSLSLGVSYSGRRAGDAPPAFTIAGVPAKTSFFLKPYYVTNFNATYRWHKYTFRLFIDNLLDDKGYIQQAGGRVSGTGITTAPGINVRFSTTYSF